MSDALADMALSAQAALAQASGTPLTPEEAEAVLNFAAGHFVTAPLMGPIQDMAFYRALIGQAVRMLEP